MNMTSKGRKLYVLKKTQMDKGRSLSKTYEVESM